MKRFHCIVVIMLWGVSFGTFAADLDRLFLTPEQRLSIDSERQAFLETKTSALLKSKKAKRQATAAQKSAVQKPLSVTAIIISPDGTQYVRLNDGYRKGLPAQKTDNIIEKRSFETQFNVNERQVVIPVGHTYLPDSKKIIKNYQYNFHNKAEQSAHETSK
ncbi:MAG: hypothetical protein HUJ13_10585 [Hydrogenovibrio crunogenus]|uniref:Uncharacterized protein n=1 Tax=Hydrogenovibrio crunogenus (strain DSM 25203 / XCL-2) TaxID=317025 RepID=Q31HY2_HYDCU|nr:hypothetical protein [Hydrogenovibrio crunogenus]